VNIGDFGVSTGETFFDLLKALDEQVNVARIRISSIEPNLLTDQMIEWIAQSKRFVPHFHIPLQSGSDDVLRLMRRRYNTQMFRRKVNKIKEVMPHAGIGIDVIVGTPGETNNFFNECYELLKNTDFTYLHVFSYSPRENTDALKIEPKVSESDKSIRSKQLHELSDQKTRAFYSSFIGTEANVLFEQKNDKGYITGFTENYIKVRVPYDKKLVNKIQKVRLLSINGFGDVDAEIVTSEME